MHRIDALAALQILDQALDADVLGGVYLWQHKGNIQAEFGGHGGDGRS
ncbi:hypothetical protein [Oryzisolibacter propanilivorax]|nr:hypothetical protein [Oryzisolibacter propanilivorax]